MWRLANYSNTARWNWEIACIFLCSFLIWCKLRVLEMETFWSGAYLPQCVVTSSFHSILVWRICCFESIKLSPFLLEMGFQLSFEQFEASVIAFFIFYHLGDTSGIQAGLLACLGPKRVNYWNIWKKLIWFCFRELNNLCILVLMVSSQAYKITSEVFLSSCRNLENRIVSVPCTWACFNTNFIIFKSLLLSLLYFAVLTFYNIYLHYFLLTVLIKYFAYHCILFSFTSNEKSQRFWSQDCIYLHAESWRLVKLQHSQWLLHSYVLKEIIEIMVRN